MGWEVSDSGKWPLQCAGRGCVRRIAKCYSEWESWVEFWLKKAWKNGHELCHPVMYNWQECLNPTWSNPSDAIITENVWLWEFCIWQGVPNFREVVGPLERQGEEGILKGLRAWFMTESCIGGKPQIFKFFEDAKTFENVLQKEYSSLLSTWDKTKNPELQFQVGWFMPDPCSPGTPFLIWSPC